MGLLFASIEPRQVSLVAQNSSLSQLIGRNLSQVEQLLQQLDVVLAEPQAVAKQDFGLARRIQIQQRLAHLVTELPRRLGNLQSGRLREVLSLSDPISPLAGGLDRQIQRRIHDPGGDGGGRTPWWN